MLFAAVGTTDWPGAWIYLGAMVLLSLGGGLLLARYDPGLLNERLSSPIQRGQPIADKILLSALLLSIAGALVLMALAVLRGIRIRIEEAALRAGFDGCDSSAARVRYRLIPLLW